MNVYSLAFFRHEASAYESPKCGASQGCFFVNYIRAITRMHPAVYPDWEMWIYHDDRVTQYPYWKAMERMQEAGLLKLIYAGKAETLCGSMLWRLKPAWAEGVDRFVCRDVDSLQTPRERKAVDRWVASGKPVSALHDSQSHSSASLMGGMTGFRAGWFKAMWPSYDVVLQLATMRGIDLNRHGADQTWLNSEVYPATRGGEEVSNEDRSTLGGRDHILDQLCAHIGGAYHVEPVVKFFDENPGMCSKLDIIRRCENGNV